MPEALQVGGRELELGRRCRRRQRAVAGIDLRQFLAGPDHGAGIDQAGGDLAGDAEGERNFVARANLARIAEHFVAGHFAENDGQHRSRRVGDGGLLAASGEQGEHRQREQPTRSARQPSLHAFIPTCACWKIDR
jgi:hypothetical protein